MAYSSPPNFAAGAILTEAQLDTLSDDISFLAGPPRCRVYNSAAISHATSGAFQALTFNSERFDTDTMHSTAVNTGRITFTTAGTYEVGACIAFAANATGNRGVLLRLNGTTYIARQVTPTAGGGDEISVSVSTVYAFSAADYIEVMSYQSSGGALNVVSTGNYTPEAWAILQAV